MKRYDRTIILSILIYLVLAISAGICIIRMEEGKTNFYKVEINRIYASLSGEITPGKLSLGKYEYVMEGAYLPVTEMDEGKINQFYEEKKPFQFEIQPWYVDGKLAGYLRFDYKEPTVNAWKTMLVAQASLGILELFLIVILVYLRQRLIQPFNKVSKLPYELARGHLKDVVKEDENKYFGKFLWSIGQLKDTLDVTRKRELELERERKQMLLSLSHDIKTPLNTIKLYAKALDEGVYQEETQKNRAIRQIGEKTKEIERYVDEIVKSSREDILDIWVDQGEFYLKDLMERVLATYEDKCAIRMINLQVGSYENCLLKGDQGRMEEVFENLFENAFKYGDGRQITITFSEEDYCQLIRIFNTGEPVTDHELNHVFESFFRGSNSKGEQGSGLGLYICRQIMGKMEGQIFAEKESDGMAFVVVLR